MKKYVAVLFGLALSLTPALHAAESQNPLLRDVLKGSGAVVYLQSEMIEAKLSDGSPTYMRGVIYHRDQRRLDNDPHLIFAPAGKMSCLLNYSTSTVGPEAKVTPGVNVAIQPGTRFKWNAEDSTAPQRYLSEINSVGFRNETINLTFFGSPLTSVSCSVATRPEQNEATLADFAEALRGVMTLEH